jgi:hypothetical protein
MNAFDIVCFSIRPHLAAEAAASILPHKTRIIDTTGMPKSAAFLANLCVQTSNSEHVIVMRDKVRAMPEHVDAIASRLDSGWAYSLSIANGFFGVNKELFRRLGPFDSRFTDGAENVDMIFRCRSAGIGVFDEQLGDEFYRWDVSTLFDVRKQWVDLKSKWDYSDMSICPDYSRGYAAGWSPTPGPKVVRRIDADRFDEIDFGPSPCAVEFMPWSRVKLIHSMGDVMAGFRGGSSLFDWQSLRIEG